MLEAAAATASTKECTVLKGIERRQAGTQEIMAGDETEYRSRIQSTFLGVIQQMAWFKQDSNVIRFDLQKTLLMDGLESEIPVRVLLQQVE